MVNADFKAQALCACGMMGVQYLDYYTTLKCISTGMFGEANPFMALVVSNPVLFTACKLGGSLLIVGVAVLLSGMVDRLPLKWKPVKFAPFVIGALIGGVAVLSNVVAYSGMII